MWNDRPLNVLALLGFVLMFAACGDGLVSPCNRCYFEEPAEHTVVLLFSVGDEHPTVDFTIYAGNLDDGIPVYYGLAEQQRVELVLGLGQRYTVVADYCDGGRSIRVVGSNKPRAEFTQEMCEEACYLVSGLRFDLRLRY